MAFSPPLCIRLDDHPRTFGRCEDRVGIALLRELSGQLKELRLAVCTLRLAKLVAVVFRVFRVGQKFLLSHSFHLLKLIIH